LIKLNIGGKKFATRKDTILSSPGSLLYKIITSEKVDLNAVVVIASGEVSYTRQGVKNYFRFCRLFW